MNIRTNYDEEYDILRVTIADQSNSYGDDDEAGLVVFRNIDSDSLTGVLIYGWKRKLAEGTLPKPPNDFPYSFINDIAPLLNTSV